MNKRLLILACLQTLCLTGCLNSETPLFPTATLQAVPGLDGTWVSHGTPRELQRLKRNAQGTYAIEDLSGRPPTERVGFIALQDDAYLVERCMKRCLYLVALPATNGMDFWDIADTPAVTELAKTLGLSIAQEELAPDTRPTVLLGFYKAVLEEHLLGKRLGHYDLVPTAATPLLEDPDRTQQQAETAEDRKDYASALAAYRPLADAAYIPAEKRLARLYLVGAGVPHDPTIAMEWLTRAAEQGDAFAQRLAGEYYLAGRGVGQSDATAASYFKLAAEQADASAQYELAALYHAGRGVAQSDVEAVKWYRRAAAQGDADAQNALGIQYETGQGVPKDLTQAVAWYNKAVDQNNAAAQFNIARLYLDGSIVPKNDALAVALLRKAAEQELPRAQYSLGSAYASGSGGLPKRTDLAVQWLGKAAALGDPAAQNDLGTMYETGQGVPKDLALAASWFRKAADQGFAVAQFNLGYLYAVSSDRHEYDSQAALWYQKAADQDDDDAQYNLGMLYLRGWGVPKNEDKGVALLNASARRGNATAKKTLAALKSDAKDRGLMFMAIGEALAGFHWENNTAPSFGFPATQSVPCYSKEELGCNWE